MSYEPRDLLDQLNTDFEFDRSRAFEFGWCNILPAEERDYRKAVWLYYPRADIWANPAARKILIRQMESYHETQDHPTLPQSMDLLKGKAASGAIVLVTARSTDTNAMQREREETGADWSDRDTFDYPAKIGATLRLSEGFALMHNFGMVHGSVGFQTLSVRDQVGKPQIMLDFLNFSEQGEKLPTSSVFAEPAFSAPELFDAPGPDGRLAYGPRTDVYGLAKFLIYVLLGPQAFMTFFLSAANEVEEDPSYQEKLFDNVLWGNSARIAAEDGVQRLQTLSKGRITNELAELLNRSVAVDPAQRPVDAAMFYEGLYGVMSTGSGGAGANNVGAAAGGVGFKMPEQPKPSSPTKYYVAAGVVLALVLGASGWMLKERAEQEALDAKIAQVTSVCRDLIGQMEASEATTLVNAAGWPELEALRERAIANGRAVPTLDVTLGLCSDGRERLVEMQMRWVADLRRTVADEVTFAGDNAADLAAVRVDDQLAAADAFQADGDFPATEGALVALVADVVGTHDAHLDDALTTAIAHLDEVAAIIAPDMPSEEAVALRDTARAQIEQAAEAELLRDKTGTLADLGEVARAELLRVDAARIASAQSVRDDLGARGADRDGTGFAAFASDLDALAATPLPEAATGFVPRFAALDDLTGRADAVRSLAEQRAAEIPALRAGLDAMVEEIDDWRWDDEGDLPALLDAYDDADPVDVFSDHATLSALSVGMTQQVAALRSEWAEGAARCQDMFALVTGVPDLDSTSVWRPISQIMVAVRGFDEPGATREDFARCAQATPLVERGRIELRAADLLEEVDRAQADAQEAGAIPAQASFADALSRHQMLRDTDLPVDEETYAIASAAAMAVIQGYDDAAREIAAAERDTELLRVRQADLVARIEGGEAAAQPEYETVTAALSPATDGTVFERNAALEENIAALSEFLRAFEAGELMNCTINGYEMAAVSIDAADAEAAYGALSTGAAFAAPASVAAGTGVRGCLAMAPVSHADLESYRRTLRARDFEISEEIEASRPAADGTATNLSYWLASRYAGFIASGADVPVCVAPAFVSGWATGAGIDGYVAPSGAEITRDACTGGVSENVTVSGGGSASCAPVNARGDSQSFRLAAGDLCQ